MESKFGSVYVVERNDLVDGSETLSTTLLKSVSFSNLDFKLYNPDGNVSPLFKEYEGRPFSLRLKLKTENKYNQPVEYEGKILLPFKLGQIAHQDFKSVPKATEKGLEFLQRQGMIPNNDNNDDGYQVVKNLKSATMIAALCPGQKICDMKLMQITVDAFFILDDFMDNRTYQKGTTFMESVHYWSVIADILEGKELDLEKIGMEQQTKTAILPKTLLNFVRVMQEFRAHLSKQDREAARHVVKVYTDYISCLSLEGCQEWKERKEDDKSVMFRSAQQDLRLISCGAWPTMEKILFDSGIRIEDKIRESFLFKYFLKTLAQHTSLVNDFVSFKKEMRAGTSCNQVYLYHVKDGLDLPEALDKALAEINTAMQALCETGKVLGNLYKGHSDDVAKMVDVAKGVLTGHLQWSSIAATTRYNQDMVYDCVVELE